MRSKPRSEFRSRHAHRHGSALLLSLWALLVLSVAVFALAQFIHQEIGLTQEANLALDARALAYSGMMVALHPQVTPRNPALVADFGSNRGYRVRIVSEASKLNLNGLLQDAAGIEILKKYLMNRGVNFFDVQRMVDCMRDWIDADDLQVSPLGAEADGDYQPSNEPFNSLEEVMKVKATGPLLGLANWQQDFTVIGMERQIDFQSASIPVMASIPNVNEPQVRMILQARQGVDKIDGTIDDQLLTPAYVYACLGMNEASPLRNYVAVRKPGDGIVRIISIGKSGKVSRQVEAVAGRRNGNASQILLWKEN